MLKHYRRSASPIGGRGRAQAGYGAPLKLNATTMAAKHIYSDPTMVAFESLYVPDNGDLSPSYTRLVGQEAHTGSITVGKTADLVLVQGDPSTRIGDLRQTRLVMLDG